jgi:hypothetical protein
MRCCRLPNKYDGKLEAPALFHHSDDEISSSVDEISSSGGATGGGGRGDYYLWASHCTYWWPNDAYVLKAPVRKRYTFGAVLR